MPSFNEVNPMTCSWEGKKVHDSSVARHLFPHPTKPFLQVIWKACPRKRITELPERHEIGFPIKAMTPWQLSWRSALVCLHSTLHSRTWHILTLDTNGIKRISNKSQNYWCWSIRFSAWKYNTRNPFPFYWFQTYLLEVSAILIIALLWSIKQVFSMIPTKK